MKNSLQCSEDRQLVEKWGHFEVNTDAMQHLHKCVVDGV